MHLARITFANFSSLLLRMVWPRAMPDVPAGRSIVPRRSAEVSCRLIDCLNRLIASIG
jgi:hypothetical protein